VAAVRTTPAPVAAVARVVPLPVTPTRTTKPPTRVARSERQAPRAKRPPPESKPKPLATRAAKVVTPVTSLPRDALRLGLPVGALIVGRPGASPDAGLLVLAALLLVVAAAGTLVLAVAARGAARHA
jgi:hypothetical protein